MRAVISVIGRPRSGKTRVVAALAGLLHERGLKVGTLKREPEDIDFGSAAADSARHYAAGADVVVAADPHKTTVMRRTPDPVPLEEVLAEFFGGVDVVLTEGYKSGPYPKIEVFSENVGGESVTMPEDRLLCVISNAELDLEAPRYRHDQIEEVVRLIRESLPGE